MIDNWLSREVDQAARVHEMVGRQDYLRFDTLCAEYSLAEGKGELLAHPRFYEP